MVAESTPSELRNFGRKRKQELRGLLLRTEEEAVMG
jgi:hypothetical protein